MLVVVLLGGFTTNFIWCLILNMRNRTGYQYFSSRDPRAWYPPVSENPPILENRHRRAARRDGDAMPAYHGRSGPRAPMLSNYLFCALAGTTWYFQFFFYTMGETQMGAYKFSSWTLHMASIIIFSTLWGIALHEWKGTSLRTKVACLSLAVLVASTAIVGYGNYLGLQSPPAGVSAQR